MNATQIASEIIQLFEKHGQESYGERVNMIQHMVQCALLAEEETKDEEVILAAFLHDVGHFFQGEDMEGYGTVSHEKIGAKFLLEKGFSEKIAALVEGHVAAKRYLTFAVPGYYERLSEASKRTLEFQGGMMIKEEAEAFEKSPWYDWSIKMRYWDDEGKIPDYEPGTLNRYQEMMVRHLEARN